VFGLGAELILARPGQRLPDLAFSLFLSLGGHVELPCDNIFINPLPGYVENEAAWSGSPSGCHADTIFRVAMKKSPNRRAVTRIQPRWQSAVLGRYFPSAVIFGNALP